MRRLLFGLVCFLLVILVVVLWPIVGLIIAAFEVTSERDDADPGAAVIMYGVGCMLVVPAWIKVLSLIG